jgi:hypothetical protein
MTESELQIEKIDFFLWIEEMYRDNIPKYASNYFENDWRFGELASGIFYNLHITSTVISRKMSATCNCSFQVEHFIQMP